MAKGALLGLILLMLSACGSYEAVGLIVMGADAAVRGLATVVDDATTDKEKP